MHPRRGAALVLVLWLILIAGLTLLGLNRSALITGTIARAEVERVQAHWLARAGIERGLAVLAADSAGYDHTSDFWYDDPGYFENVELAAGYSYRVTAPPRDGDEDTTPRFGLDDEASRVNVNANKPNQLVRIPGITEARAAAIRDWVDGNEEAEPGGAERGYYNELDFPYLIRNRPMRTARELLLIRDIGFEDHYGEDVNNDGVLNANENDGNATWPDDNADHDLELGFAAYTTVFSYDTNTNAFGTERVNLKSTTDATLMSRFSMTQSLAEAVRDRAGNTRNLFDLAGVAGEGEVGEDEIGEITADWIASNWEELTLTDDDRTIGMINVNTASRGVLETVPQMEPGMADAIIQGREAVGGYLGLGGLYKTALSEREFQSVARHLTVRSNVFRIVSTGRTPSGQTQTIAVVVDRGADPPVILEWRQND